MSAKMKLSDIKYETDGYFVLAVGARGFEVYRKTSTHSERCAQIGFQGQRGLDRAIEECNRREGVDAAKDADREMLGSDADFFDDGEIGNK